MQHTARKIHEGQFDAHLVGLKDDSPLVRRQAVSGLAGYTGPEWEGSPEAAASAADALISSCLRNSGSPDGALRADATRALGNIGAQSPAVVPKLVRLLEDDADANVRLEAARGIGKIGPPASAAAAPLVAVLLNGRASEVLRGEAARALARVAPAAPATLTALRQAAQGTNGFVGASAAEALSRIPSAEAEAVLKLAAWLSDPKGRSVAAQALYRIGPRAKAAMPALRAVSKDRDRLFQEAVGMAMRKIDQTLVASSPSGSSGRY